MTRSGRSRVLCFKQRAHLVQLEGTSAVLTGHIEVDQPLVSTHFIRGNTLVHD